MREFGERKQFKTNAVERQGKGTSISLGNLRIFSIADYRSPFLIHLVFAMIPFLTQVPLGASAKSQICWMHCGGHCGIFE